MSRHRRLARSARLQAGVLARVPRARRLVRGEATVLIRRNLVVGLALGALLAALLLLAPLLPEPSTALQFRLGAYPFHAAYFLVLALLVTWLGPLWQVQLRWLLAAVVLLGVLVVALNILDVPVLSDVAKACFGGLAGVAFVRAVERPWWLVPIAICVPLADAWSVFSERGVTHAVVDRAREEPAWIDWPTLATPIAGFDYDQFGRIGIVDVLFLGLFMGAAIRWRLGTWRGIVLLSLGLLTTSVLVLEGLDVAVPALPLLCLAFLVAYAPALWRDARAARREASGA